MSTLIKFKNKIQPLLVFQLLFLTVFSFAQATSDQHQKDKKELSKQIFPGAPLPSNFKFHFNAPFKEEFVLAKDNIKLSALLFTSDSSKGVILYLHGNAEALNKWGEISEVYTKLHYDIFMIDYRGYGKSPGTIKSEEQLYSDVQEAYNFLTKLYPENKITIIGYSIGTGPAAMLAAKNNPRRLILQAPYYSLTDLIQYMSPTIDTTTIPFKLNTYKFIPKIKVPIFIFHGDADETIYYGSSEKLKKQFKQGDELITLKGAGHQGMSSNKEYLKELKRILN
ncbi:MAG: alpha/beta hydrolase [Bacteroidia bacterium]